MVGRALLNSMTNPLIEPRATPSPRSYFDGLSTSGPGTRKTGYMQILARERGPDASRGPVQWCYTELAKGLICFEKNGDIDEERNLAVLHTRGIPGQVGRSEGADGGEGCGLHDGTHAGELVLPNRVPDSRLLLVPDPHSYHGPGAGVHNPPPGKLQRGAPELGGGQPALRGLGRLGGSDKGTPWRTWGWGRRG